MNSRRSEWEQDASRSKLDGGGQAGGAALSADTRARDAGGSVEPSRLDQTGSSWCGRRSLSDCLLSLQSAHTD